jgi:cytochrome c
MRQNTDMKKLSLCFSAALLMAACGGSNASESTAQAATKPSKTVSELTPVQRGAKLYKRCKTCHTLEQDGRHKVGPNLWDIYGSKSGSKEGFNYSKAMIAADIIWDEKEMDAYLKRPSAYMPGNRMTFIGLKKQEDRDAIQAYLKEKTTP